MKKETNNTDIDLSNYINPEEDLLEDVLFDLEDNYQLLEDTLTPEEKAEEFNNRIHNYNKINERDIKYNISYEETTEETYTKYLEDMKDFMLSTLKEEKIKLEYIEELYNKNPENNVLKKVYKFHKDNILNAEKGLDNILKIEEIYTNR